MTRTLSLISCIAAIVIASTSLSDFAVAKPGGGGGPHGGAPRGGGGAPGGGPRGGGIHMGAPHGGPRLTMPHSPAARAFHAPRVHAAPRIRAARPAFHARAMTARRAARASVAVRAAHRSGFSRRALSRSLGANAARRSTLSNRAAASPVFRSSAVHARGDARSTNPVALRAFSGRNAQIAAARIFRDPALARHRFDPAFSERVRFAGAFWPGPYFWPYAYYDEAFWFWPSAYDEVFWSYGYDDVLYSVFRPYAFTDYGDFADLIGRPVRRARGHQPAPRSFAEFCGEAAPGLTDWPVDQIAAVIEPTPPQRALLDELIKASDKAAEFLRNACPRNVSVTPMGRLDALQQQLAALDQAVRIVRPALEKFYASLSDDQKERFNALAPKSGPDRRRTRTVAAPQADRLARACQNAETNPDWPIGRIEETVRPDQRQRAALNELRAATDEAARIVRSACPSELPLTPTGRLAAMEQRIDAMLQAIGTLRPALAKFYAALNDEQKARLNRALLDQARRTG